MSEAQGAWDGLRERIRELEAINSVLGVLAWDQQTYQPARGAAWRGTQTAALSRLVHERVTDGVLESHVKVLEGHEADALQRASVRNTRRSIDRMRKVPPDLVTRVAEAQAAGFDVWVKAKTSSDFSLFAPALRKLIDLTKERAHCIDPSRHPYDVLLEDYDPGTTVASLRTLFGSLKPGLRQLLDAVAKVAPVAEDDLPLPIELQRSLHDRVIRAMGYDLDAGRLDVAEHPFTVGIGPGDTRITTHFYAERLLAGLSGTMHETGHALYEQGLPHERWGGTWVNVPASCGLHESQSRFWENFIGRSRPFFGWLAEAARGDGIDLDPEHLYRASNRVRPSLIRIYADEVTYNLHILVRFELEVRLVEGTLAVEDLPAAWNEAYRDSIGVVPPDDAHGVLQDVHWSSGMFGYFPSYTLGNLYAASLGAAMTQALPDLWDRVGRGDFAPILGWLREKVHDRGHLFDAPDIVREAVGDRNPVEDLLSHLWGRHGALYGMTRP